MSGTQKKNVLPLLLAGLIAAILGSAVAVQAVDEETAARIVDYYVRTRDVPMEAETTLRDVRQSKIPGADSAVLEISRGDQKQEVGILISRDGRYVVFGSVEDVTADPFAEALGSITLAGQPTRGAEDAKVTIVEFSDFQCPYCARAYGTLSGRLLKQYGGKVRFVYKNLPMSMHRWAEAAAIAGECAFSQDEKTFWVLYDYYFQHQSELTPENLQAKTLAIVSESGIDTARFIECLDSEQARDRVHSDVAEAEQLGIISTPVFLINGRKISGAQPFEKFKQIIDDELARAG